VAVVVEVAMSAHFQRGELLFEQSRYDQAANELTAHLGENPNDGAAHALLAISLASLKRFDDALAHAREAIGIDPEDGVAHYSLAFTELERCRYKAAAKALEEAIRCAPLAANFHSLLAALRARQQRWPAALEAAERGLECDPEHLECLNMRALAQRQLGMNAAAAETMRDALARDPNDELAHANQGWALLEEGRASEALTHFREALRLSPDLEYARLGILEALKAQNPIYRAILRYLLWMGKQPMAVQWGIMLGLLVAMRMVDRLGGAVPAVAPVLWALNTAVLLVAMSTFFARPLFNFVLLFHPLGRLAMTGDQKAQGGLTAVLVSLFLVFFFWSRLKTGLHWHNDALIVLLVLAIPALSIHDCQRGWPRWSAIGLTLAGPVLYFVPLLLALVLPSELVGWLPLQGMSLMAYKLVLVLGVYYLCDWLEDVELAE
jgi:tetratricopeptide (TPR) repeat protein